VKLVSLVGDDEAGRAILSHLSALGVDVSQTALSLSSTTAEYVAILDKSGELHLGLAAMDAFEAITPAVLDRAWSHIASSRWTFADCNLPEDTLHALLQRKAGTECKLAVNTVSVPKALRLPGDLSAIDVLFTNAEEARALLGSDTTAPEKLTALLTARGAQSVVLTLGAEGHIIADRDDTHRVRGLDCDPVDVTGAGDALMAGTLYRLMRGKTLLDASHQGAVLASLTVESPFDVPPDLSPAWLDSHADRLSCLTAQRLPTP
jgi:pseudouridine kinase